MEELLLKLKAYNIDVKVEEGNLKLQIPNNLDAKDILVEVKNSKAELIAYISNMLNQNNKFDIIPKAKNQSNYKLSSAQKRLYLLQQMDLASIAYNLPFVISLGKEVSKEKINEVFQKLLMHHESFRTSFEVIGEEPVQLIHEEIDFKVEEYNITKSEISTKRKEFVQPFDLSKAPLLRVAIVYVEGDDNLLMIDIHHIISDGVSHNILEKDYQRLYSGEELSPLNLQYVDYSEWQNSKDQKEKLKKQEDYWLKIFGGENPVLNLPTDYIRPLIQSKKGAIVKFALSKKETENIKLFSKENDLTLYMSVLSVFTILLSKLSGQNEIIVGTPIAGRNHPDLEVVVGMFVNTLAIRNEINKDDTLKEFIKKLKQNTLEVFENQDYQFEDLVDKVSVERNISRNPLFDVMFNLLNQTDYSGDLSVFDNQDYVHSTGISKFDLSMTVADYGEQLLFNLQYCTKLFKSETIERFIAYFKKILSQLKVKLEEKISTLEIITDKEKQQLLYDFNATERDYPKDKTLQCLFEEQVERTPERMALVYNDQCITYRELNSRSNQLGHLLIEKGLKTESIIAILVDRSLEMILGILGILKAGCAYLPLDKESPKERMKHIISESNVDILLTTDLEKKDYEFSGEILNISDTSIYSEKEVQNINKGLSTDLVYVIYTSGSTGQPKGVMVEHKNVVNLVTGLSTRIYDSYEQTLHISLISPIYFDASVKQIFPSLTLGHSLHIIPEDTRFEASELLRYYAQHDIQVADGTPVHAQLLVQNKETNIKGLNLRQFILGGDELKIEIIQSLFDKFDNHDLKISNVYGPTECTDVTTIQTETKESLTQQGIPSIGTPLPNYEIFILGKNLELLPLGVSGELCVGGEGLVRGYLYNEKLTSEKFINHPFKEGERLYRTGDVARWLPDGKIEFLGRLDHQVKIRGFRIELGEIENVLQKNENIKESVVLAREENGDKYICAYIVAEEEFNQEEIRTYLSASLPDYMIPSYFVELERIPLTSNGKVNRKALPLPEVKAGDDYVVASNETEEKLVEIWSEVLNITKEDISVTANFFAIGGHSLKATILIGRIHKEIGVEFPLRDVFIHSNIKAQASRIITSTKKDFVNIPKAKKQEYYALSSAQKRLYLLQEMEPESTAYNMPYMISLGSEAEKEKIEETFRQLISRHESFRTSFEIVDEEPVQHLHEQVEFTIEEFNIEKDEIQNQRHQFIQAFDLSKAPLLRVAKVDVKGESSLLMIDMHHIISDGVSQAILEQDFQRLYSGKELSELTLQYKDYSEWQNSQEQQIKVKNQGDYWIGKFEGEIPVLDLPTDYVRPVIKSHEGANVNFVLSKEETQHIKSLAKENDLTLYMSVLSIFSILLSKLSGQEDVVVGTAIAGRSHPDLDGIVGMFVNTLAIRNKVDGNQTLLDYLHEIKQTTIEVYENQDYQFEDLVENVAVARDISRNPLLDVMFNLLNQVEYSGNLSDFVNNQYVHTTGISKFDLTLIAVDYQDQLLMTFEYCTKLFKSETIERYIKYFKYIIFQLEIKKDEKISLLEIIPEEEKQYIINKFNNTRSEYCKETTIHGIFEDEVRKNPNHLAVINGDKELSYRELNERANQMAHYLIERGVKAENETIVGIELEPSYEFVVCMLGVLKSGGAYLPIDKNLPEKRKRYIVENSKLKILIHNNIDYREIDSNIELTYYKDIELEKYKLNNPNINVNITNLAYIIYTSGTSGNPKGTLLEHKGIVSENIFWKGDLEIESSDRCIQFANISFDASVWEICSCLLNGASLYIPERSIKEDVQLFDNYLINNKITVATLPPVFAENLNAESFKGFRLLVTAGSETKSNLIERFNKKTRYINAYGPTETSICATYWETSEYEKTGKISIGKPIRNIEVYILNVHNYLQGIGIPGELCISGDGLARGYLHLPELTQEKFISHPFKDGERLYRTGDLARWLPDGNIEFLGRIDDQVKIRGFRIELGEIENVLLKYKSIKESVVIAREENGDKYLCAYLVTEEDFNQEEIRTYLSASLPDYMIPLHFVELDSIPLTSNGKVNRKALPIPEIQVKDYIAPRNNIEEKLVEIWSEVLGVAKEKISIDANFFELGGHSLFMIKVVQKITNIIGYKLKVMDLFKNTTVRKLTNYIEGIEDFDVTKNDRIEEIEKGKSSMKILLNKTRS